MTLAEPAAQVDVLIVGGGVTGTALLFCLARYTDLQSVVLVDKEEELAAINSRASNNSQTIHCGDIETNYSLEKALQVKRRADMLVHYGQLLQPDQRRQVITPCQKMVLGVGAEQCAFLRQRFETFSPHFPAMQWLDSAAIATWEPAVATAADGGPRPETIAAIGIPESPAAVNYGALAESFVDQARLALEEDRAQGHQRNLDVQLGCRVRSLRSVGDRVHADTEVGSIEARYVVVSAGAHSLLLAQAMGHGLQYSCLPVAGSFYFLPQVLRGKVYTVQNDRLPFAAIHGDPDVLVPDKTRFGPTALLLPLLERYRPASFWEFLRVLRLDGAVLAVFWQLFRVADIRNYILRNVLFEVPFLRRWLFLQDLRRIVPAARLDQLEVAHGFGGVRPQLIDREQRRLLLGEARITTDGPITFNVTPSPGGTDCLGNAEVDLRSIVAQVGCGFREDRLQAELHGA
ncbi:MAG: FAD-dependent oxidoreductase [Synechococcus sp.]